LAFSSLVIAQHLAVTLMVQTKLLSASSLVVVNRPINILWRGSVLVNGNWAVYRPSVPVVRLQGVCRERQAKRGCKAVMTREVLRRAPRSVRTGSSASSVGSARGADRNRASFGPFDRKIRDGRVATPGSCRRGFQSIAAECLQAFAYPGDTASG